MKSKLKILVPVALAVFILDHFTKWLIVKKVPFGRVIPVWKNFFDIVHVRNKGAAFGFLSQWESQYRDLFFYFLAAGALVFLFYFLRQMVNRWHVAPVGLIIGGALGNIVDRAVRGSVVDFLSLHWYNERARWEVFGYLLDFELTWPAFNVADSTITVGVIWLMLVTWKESAKQD